MKELLAKKPPVSKTKMVPQEWPALVSPKDHTFIFSILFICLFGVCINFALKKSVQFSRSVVSDSVTPWAAAHQTSLSITNSQSLLKLMSIESVMPSNHLILCCPLLLPQIGRAHV